MEIGASGSGGGGDDPVRYTIHFDSNGGSDISDMKADRGTLMKSRNRYGRIYLRRLVY